MVSTGSFAALLAVALVAFVNLLLLLQQPIITFRSSEFEPNDEEFKQWKENEALLASIVSRIENNENITANDDEVQKMQIILQNRTVTDFSLMIPCLSDHFPYFNQWYSSLLLQTVLPSEVLIGFSFPNKNVENLPIILNLLPIPQTQVFNRSGIFWTGDNRNFLMERGSKDVFSFFDCDDYMHPQRIQYISTVMKNNKDVDVLLHGFNKLKYKILTRKDKFQYYSKFKYSQEQMDSWKNLWKREDMYKLCQQETSVHCDVNTWSRYYKIKRFLYPWAHGYMSLRKMIKDELVFESMPTAEDLVFTTQIVKMNKTLTGIDEPLGIYTKPSNIGKMKVYSKDEKK